MIKIPDKKQIVVADTDGDIYSIFYEVDYKTTKANIGGARVPTNRCLINGGGPWTYLAAFTATNTNVVRLYNIDGSPPVPVFSFPQAGNDFVNVEHFTGTERLILGTYDENVFHFRDFTNSFTILKTCTFGDAADQLRRFTKIEGTQ
jgi:hypothetical protein